MKRFVMLFVAVVLAAGCATQGTSVIETTYDKNGVAVKTVQNLSDYAAYAKAHEPSKERPKLMDIECPPTGCNFTKFIVYDPQSGGAQPNVAAPPESLAATLVKETFTTLRMGIPYASGAAVLMKAFDKANASSVVDNSNHSVTTTTTTTSTSSSSTSVNASGPGSGAAAGGSANGSTTSNTDSHNTDSHDSTTNTSP